MLFEGEIPTGFIHLISSSLSIAKKISFPLWWTLTRITTFGLRLIGYKIFKADDSDD